MDVVGENEAVQQFFDGKSPLVPEAVGLVGSRAVGSVWMSFITPDSQAPKDESSWVLLDRLVVSCSSNG